MDEVKRLLCSASLLGALTATVAFGTSGCGEKKPAPPPPPPTVLVAPVVRQDLALFIEAVGSLDGFVNADIRARVNGYLRSQNYKDGSAVKEGQLLFTIEPGEYQNAVAAAAAALVRARAAKQNGQVSLARNQALAEQGLVSTQVVDNAVAQAADANGQVLAAQAALSQAQLNLSYTKVHSPVSGVAGLALVRVGNLVGQDGPTLLTTVSQLDPIRVNFPMSEIDYVRFPNRLKNLGGRDVAWAREQFTTLDAKQNAEGDDPGIELLLAGGSLYPHRGVLVAANRQVDTSTGTIQLQALFPNVEGALRPGQYGRVRIQREDQGKAELAVSEKALINVQGSYSVAVVGADNKAKLRQVELGPPAQGMRIVLKGLTEGEVVVVEGVQKVTDGAPVTPKPAPAPAPMAVK
jgi:membrane fusion protein, multidrug efflux system